MLVFRAAGVFRGGVARRCAKVVAVVMDVGVISMVMGREGVRRKGAGALIRWPRSRDQGRGESDCSHPDRKSKTSTPRGAAGEKRCNFTSQITSGMDERKISQ